jgi:uncharacterized glyoxalase superfamily protein PhnB
MATRKTRTPARKATKTVAAKRAKSTAAKATAAVKATARKTTKRTAARKPARAAASKPRGVSPIPAGFTTVTPHLVVKDAASAIDFYKKAFGAVEKKRHTMPDGKIMYALIAIGDTPIHLADEFPMMEHWKSPDSIGGTSVGIHIYVKDADSVYNRAIEAGARQLFPLADAFWGDRYGSVIDPFGHAWSIATHKQDLTDAQVMKAAMEFFGSMQPA